MSETVKETAYIELIGADEQVAQDQWSGSVNVPIKQEGQGLELAGLLFRWTFDQTAAGAAMAAAGELVFFHGDPSLTSGTAKASLTATQVGMIHSYITLATGDWEQWDTTGADASEIAYLRLDTHSNHLPRMGDGDLYAAFLWEDATATNSAGTDEEVLQVKIIYCS